MPIDCSIQTIQILPSKMIGKQMQKPLPPTGNIRGVIFDVYGTLAEIRNKTSPYRKLLELGEAQGRPRQPVDAELIMSRPLGLSEAATNLGITLTNNERQQLESLLAAEVESIELFDDVATSLQHLQQRGLKLALCSNLAAPYAQPIAEVLPISLDAYTWSFSAGAIKPTASIYLHTCEALGLSPQEVVMVGDTYDADVAGPINAGLQAIWLRRDAKYSAEWINSLEQLSEWIK